MGRITAAGLGASARPAAALRSSVLLLALLSALLTGCGGDGTSPPDPGAPVRDSVSGLYVATRAVGTLGGEETDYLAAGGAVDLTLARDGTAWGTAYLPGADGGGADLSDDLTGSWHLEGWEVTLQLASAGFLTGVPIRVKEGGGLTCVSRLADGSRIELTFARLCGCTCGPTPSSLGAVSPACAARCRC